MTNLAIASDRGDTAEKTATVFVVDDDSEVRRSIGLLAKSVDLRVELFENARDFLNTYTNDQPGCLILDVRMPGMSGLELQKKMVQEDYRIPIIILTSYAEVSLATHSMRTGAVDFLQKPYSPQLLLERIYEAIQADAKARQTQADHDNIATLTEGLSCREREVMKMLTLARSTKRIARDLGISIKTVDNHRASILGKMRVDSVPELMRLVMNYSA